MVPEPYSVSSSKLCISNTTIDNKELKFNPSSHPIGMVLRNYIWYFNVIILIHEKESTMANSAFIF